MTIHNLNAHPYKYFDNKVTPEKSKYPIWPMFLSNYAEIKLKKDQI